MSSYDVETPLTISDFVNKYNADIEFCILASNYGFAAEIDQAESPLEKHLKEQQAVNRSGIKELENLEPEHNNFINRFLAYIH